MGKSGERCPICKRYTARGVTCSNCYPDNEDEKNAFADFVDDHNENPFIPKDFGIIKDKFGYEER
jgi:hypothetical protein